jgi:hypothetical protein
VVAPKTTTPTVKPRTNVTTTPTFQSAPQGFSAGPTLLGQPRMPLGHMVNRIPPDFDGDGYIEHRKVPQRR